MVITLYKNLYARYIITMDEFYQHICITYLETEKFSPSHDLVYIKNQALALVNDRQKLQIQDTG